MITQQVPRGATVDIYVTFRDGDGNIFTADTATLYVNYPTKEGGREQVEIEMSEADLAWTGRWDSSVAGIGQVDWHARGFAGDVKSAAQGSYVLTGNRGNPEG